MRTSILFTAAFAATAFSTPLRQRDVEVDTVVDIVYVTDIVTETAGVAPAATSTTESAESSATAVVHWGHHSWHQSSSSSVAAAPSSTSEAAPTSTYVAPTTSAAASTSTSEAAPTSTYVAPTTSAVPTPESSTTAEATSTSAAAASVASTYQQAVVNHHNYHRTNHSAPAIVWNQTLSDIAKTIASSCTYAHNVVAGGGGYGQNIAAGVQSGQVGEVVTNLFYNGEVNNYASLYGQASPDMSNFENWGHFSQIVWKSTVSVGCYTQACSALANTGGDIDPYFTVCNYYPPGNYAGEYTQVGSSLGEPSVQGTYNVAPALASSKASQG